MSEKDRQQASQALDQQPTGFAAYGPEFQEKVMQALLHDHKWAQQMYEVVDMSYFDKKHIQFLCQRYFDYYKKYKCFPSLPMLLTIVRDELKLGHDTLVRDSIVEFVTKIKGAKDLGDLPYVKDKALDFCRKQAMKDALLKSVDLINGGKLESVVSTMRDALSVGTAPQIGHDFFNELEARLTRVNRSAVSTGLEQLDQRTILDGGLGRGELACVVGNTGVGKCTKSDTYIQVRYVRTLIDNKAYDPWDKLEVQQAAACAHEIIEERVKIGELFERMGFAATSAPTDDSGDSVMHVPFHLEVESLDGYRRVEALRWTKPERYVQLLHRSSLARSHAMKDCLPVLKCSPEHLVYVMPHEKPYTHASCTNDDGFTFGGGWKHVGNLLPGDMIDGKYGARVVSGVYSCGKPERLCDMQVDGSHSYYTNGILSHNSHILIFLAANALRERKTVVHYTFELSETYVGLRYDSNLCDIPASDVIMSKAKVEEKYRSTKFGRLIVKEYPPNACSVVTIRNHLERLDVKGIKPDMLIVDYADIMKSTRAYDSLRHELKFVYEELRALGVELNIPIWTGSQAHRDSAKSDIVGLENMSEAYAKAMVSDFVMSISRKPLEKASGVARLFIAKNRMGRDGLVFPITIDTSKSMIKITGDEPMQMADVSESDRGMLRTRLKEKWNAVQASHDVKIKSVK